MKRQRTKAQMRANVLAWIYSGFALLTAGVAGAFNDHFVLYLVVGLTILVLFGLRIWAYREDKANQVSEVNKS